MTLNRVLSVCRFQKHFNKFKNLNVLAHCSLQTRNEKFVPINTFGKNCFSSSAAKYALPQRPQPYVAAPYSYAFGRSDKDLVFKTIGDLLSDQALKEPNKSAVISCHEDISKTFAEFELDVNKLSKSFYERLGLRRGDVLALWSCNCYDWIVAQYAAAKLGLILCTLNPVYRAPELEYGLRKAKVKCLVMPGKGSPQEKVNAFKDILDSDRMLQKSEEKLSDYQIENVVYLDGENEAVRTMPNAKTHSLADLMQNDGQLPEGATKVDPDDTALIMYTSGTTGKPKGAFLSQFTLVNNAILVGKSFDHEENEQRRTCLPLPLFHSFGGILGSIGMSAGPAAIVLPGYRYDTPSVVNALVKHQCTHLMLTPTMIIDIIDHIDKNRIEGVVLKNCNIGGAAMPAEVAKRIEKIIPTCKDVRIGYGATELGPCSTNSYPQNTVEQRMETVGSPLDFVEIKVIDPVTEKIVKIGEQGELLSRGHLVMLGYWEEPAKTAEVMRNGWYKTGDLAVMTPEGFFKIVGRTKELIIRGGENIYPREVEEMLHAHPDIFDAYVVGVPDERVGEELCAWIKLKNTDKKLTPEEIKEFAKDKISYFKIPRHILFVEEFPLTSTGKAKKYVMREESCKILGL